MYISIQQVFLYEFIQQIYLHMYTKTCKKITDSLILKQI